MTRWPGQWPGAWPGDWQGGQEASPFANMAMRATALGSLTATLEAVGGGPVYADLALVAQGAGALVGTLAGGEESPAVKTGGGGPAFRPKSKRHASPYRDLRETAAELLSRDTLEASEVSDIPAPVEAAKPAPRKVERRDNTPDILADIAAQAAAASVMGDAIRAVESQLRAAIEAKEMDEDEAVALILILAEV